MLVDFKNKFPKTILEQEKDFPVLNGCDDFLERLSLMNLSGEKGSTTTLMTADFGDAFTNTSIPRLSKSISTIGHILGYENDHIEIIVDLVELVFLNAYFYTPFGLYRQSKGMPMGDFSSRESLDVVLSGSEFEILNLATALNVNLKMFVRLVDDISVVTQNQFDVTIELMKLMVRKYPEMPLNFQLSFGYCRFLDLHVFNIMDVEKPVYKITHTLAYKEHSSFCYTPCFSNIHEKYKHAVVPITLFRIHTSCNKTEEVNHDLHFIRNAYGRFFKSIEPSNQLKTANILKS